MTLNPLAPFRTYLRPYRRMVVLGLVLLLIGQAIQTVIPLILKWAIDAGKGYLDARHNGLALPATYSGSIKGDLAWAGLVLAGVGVTQWLANFWMRYNFTGLSRYVERDLREFYVRHLVRLPLRFFHERQVGELMARATNDVEAIQRFLHHAFRMSLTGIMTFFLSLALMCTIDWKLALLSLIPMPITVIVARMVAGPMRAWYRDVQDQFGTMVNCVGENLTGVRVVKAFARREPEIGRFRDLNEEYVSRNHRLINLRSLFYPFTFFLSGASLVVILWLGGMQVMAGTLTLGSFVAFNAYLIRMSRPMMMLGRMVDEYQRASASLYRIESITRERPQPTGVDEDTESIRGEIEFRNVTFAYGDGEPVIEKLDLKIPAGSTLAIVGRVGSGKSTLARLIPRLAEATEGEVLIDGVDVNDIPLPKLRAAIGYVPQETFLFSATVEENVALGMDDRVDVEVKAATEISRLSGDLENFPRGLETIVGERGVTLSGGQKQRTALARAVIREPKILILDDAMSSVDTRTEEAILAGLRGVMRSRTTILIAHRVSTVKDADHIIVMDDGDIVEQGTHEELVARDGIYGEMFRRQGLAEEIEEL